MNREDGYQKSGDLGAAYPEMNAANEISVPDLAAANRAAANRAGACRADRAAACDHLAAYLARAEAALISTRSDFKLRLVIP